MKPKIPASLVTMSRSSYLWRGALYFVIAFLGVLQLGLETGKPMIYIFIAATGAGLTAVRAYIDKSPAQVDRGTTDVNSSPDSDNAGSTQTTT